MTNPTTREHAARPSHPSGQRCQRQHPIPSWPYVQRCTSRATQRVLIPTDGELDLCDACARDADAFMSRQGQS